MARRLVSEKTLELNLCASILNAVRLSPGAARAFWIGMKQDQEFRSGIDELLANLPPGDHLALQFKSPARLPPDAAPYQFGIGTRQNSRLLTLAGRRPNSVFYVFPHYNTFARIRADAPNMLTHSYALAVTSTSALSCTHAHHRVESFEGPRPHVVIHSEPTDVETQTLVDLFDHRPPPRTLLTADDIAGWLREAVVREETARAVAQELRGFRLLAIPRPA